jgi:hypothetical protein
MPTPIIAGVIRVQAILKGLSGLPEDRFITTWHFRTPLTGAEPPSGGAQALHHSEAREKVRQFYLDVVGTSTVRVSDYFSAAVTRGVNALELRSYHLGDAEPRVPQTSFHQILGNAPTTSFPAEVAVTCSFSGGQGLPRQRGRTYIGPLASSTLVTAQEATTNRVRVAAAAMLNIGLAAQRMSGGTDTTAARWCVYSPTNNNTVLVTRGYVDDAFDTQRRRGEDPVTRSSWVTA